jgi:hypothetical protein
VSPPMDGEVTVTDNETPDHPGITLPAEYEHATQVCVHAEHQPAIGDWQPCDGPTP